MSVACFADPESALTEFLGSRLPEHCSWCGKPLADPVVFWHLAGGHSLSLHLGCAEDLGGTLIFEARRAASIAAGQSLLAGIDRRWHKLARSEPR
jgi:hypothetical protein